MQTNPVVSNILVYNWLWNELITNRNKEENPVQRICH